ncbi:urease accessory protein [Achlya hypogyna]|uniref:Urease accessory protein n=1 Tax=Achlya hypogyna TaxID=1202772 RepID=A0A1V9ZSW7_ACHHY|nr:urease accessory protein [Achlya hypogyna]
MSSWTCSACLEAISESCAIRQICGDDCPAALCKPCFLRYLDIKAKDALLGVVTSVHCPTCMKPASFFRLDALAPKNSALRKLRDASLKACTVRCASCDKVNCLLPPPGIETIERHGPAGAWTAFLSSIPEASETNKSAFIRECVAYCCHERSPQQLLAAVEAILKATVATVLPALLPAIYDVERRARLFLSWRRREPFATTRCCERSVCFVCQTDGHHAGVPCQDQLALVADVAQCPQCHLVLVKVDGCNAMVCYCGKNFDWAKEVTTYQHRAAFDVHRHIWSRICFFLRARASRTRHSTFIVSQIPSAVLQLKLVRISQFLATVSPLKSYLRRGIAFRRYDKCVVQCVPSIVTAWHLERHRRQFSATTVPAIVLAVREARFQVIQDTLSTSAALRGRFKSLLEYYRHHHHYRAFGAALALLSAAVAARRFKQLEAALPRWTAFRREFLRYVFRRRYNAVVAQVVLHAYKFGAAAIAKDEWVLALGLQTPAKKIKSRTARRSKAGAHKAKAAPIFPFGSTSASTSALFNVF